MKTLGQKIRQYRESRGLLLRQVAAAIEIDQAILSKIERGERIATKNQIISLEKYFGVKKDELLTDWLGEKIAYVILNEEKIAKEVLRVAEETFLYLSDQKTEPEK